MSDTFDDVRDLYQEVILDHGRRPRYGRRLAAFDATAKGDNPMCGDRVQVFVRYDTDGRVLETGFEARGCAISIASADLMSEVVRGKSRNEVRTMFEEICARFTHVEVTGPAVYCTPGDVIAATADRLPVRLTPA